jgi:hypothetical protein
MLPDAPLLFFYTIFLIFLITAINKQDNILWWILAGFFLGLSFLSKYTAALIPPAILLYFLISRKNRSLLKTAYPYISLFIAIFLFSPVLYWNAIHNFISFQFQLSHGFSSPKPGLILFIRGWLSQFIAITPFLYIFILYSFIYSFYLIIFKFKSLSSPSLKSFNENILFSLCMSAPILIFFIANGYSHSILIHWPDLGYISAFPLAGYLTGTIIDKIKIKNKKFKLFKFYIYFSLFFGLFSSTALYYQTYYNVAPVGKIIRFIDKEQRLNKGGIYKLIPHIPGKPNTANITNDLFGWGKSAYYINIIYKGYKIRYPSFFILTHHYAISDELVFYAKFKPAKNIYNISGFLNQYDLWQNLNKINGKDALFIMDSKYMINPITTYKRFFKSIKKIGSLDIYTKFHLVKVFYLYLMKDFKSKQAIKYTTYRLY